MKYRQIITEPDYVAHWLNNITKANKRIKYVIPCHRYDGTMIVIVYAEGNK